MKFFLGHPVLSIDYSGTSFITVKQNISFGFIFINSHFQERLQLLQEDAFCAVWIRNNSIRNNLFFSPVSFSYEMEYYFENQVLCFLNLCFLYEEPYCSSKMWKNLCQKYEVPNVATKLTEKLDLFSRFPAIPRRTAEFACKVNHSNTEISSYESCRGKLRSI